MPRSLRLLAIDPGELVGWANGTAHPGLLELDGHGITPAKEFMLKLGKVIEDYDLVIYENFRLIKNRLRDGDALLTPQIVGMIRYLGWISNVTLVKQSPTIKGTADKAATGIFKDLIERESSVHDDAHDIDAIRHLYYYWWKQIMDPKEASHGK